MADPPRTLGVVGAGTMGAGIAQLGCLAGMEVLLHDPVAEALASGAERVREGLEKGAAHGRWSEQDAATAGERLTTAPALEELAASELVIEAAPERAELKRDLFTRLSQICRPEAVLATNTSSIPVTSLASAAARPENVVGMHFFNPAPLMRLLEVIAADQSSERAIAAARAAGEAMGKRVILAADGPGFLVNRCGRPFGAEALRLLQERVATYDAIDRICRLGGGFRMGPFELMDLVGVDVGYEVARSFTELSFGEPRWKPSPIQARMVAAGRLGRKSGHGYYDYSNGPHRPEDAAPPPAGGGEGRRVAIVGDGPVGEGLRARARTAGFELAAAVAPADVRVDTRVARLPAWDPAATDTPLVFSCAAASLASRGLEAVGFVVVPPLQDSKLVELTRLPGTPAATARAAEELFSSLGFLVEWVEDAPGLVLGRIVAQLVNEAHFAVGEGAGSPEDVDAGMRLGLNHPRGPFEWGEEIGIPDILASLDWLWGERHEERYRAAPLLRRRSARGRPWG